MFLTAKPWVEQAWWFNVGTFVNHTFLKQFGMLNYQRQKNLGYNTQGGVSCRAVSIFTEENNLVYVRTYQSEKNQQATGYASGYAAF